MGSLDDLAGMATELSDLATAVHLQFNSGDGVLAASANDITQAITNIFGAMESDATPLLAYKIEALLNLVDKLLAIAPSASRSAHALVLQAWRSWRPLSIAVQSWALLGETPKAKRLADPDRKALKVLLQALLATKGHDWEHLSSTGAPSVIAECIGAADAAKSAAKDEALSVAHLTVTANSDQATKASHGVGSGWRHELDFEAAQWPDLSKRLKDNVPGVPGEALDKAIKMLESSVTELATCYQIFDEPVPQGCFDKSDEVLTTARITWFTFLTFLLLVEHADGNLPTAKRRALVSRKKQIDTLKLGTMMPTCL